MSDAGPASTRQMSAPLALGDIASPPEPNPRNLRAWIVRQPMPYRRGRAPNANHGAIWRENGAAGRLTRTTASFGEKTDLSGT